MFDRLLNTPLLQKANHKKISVNFHTDAVSSFTGTNVTTLMKKTLILGNTSFRRNKSYLSLQTQYYVFCIIETDIYQSITRENKRKVRIWQKTIYIVRLSNKSASNFPVEAMLFLSKGCISSFILCKL